MWFYRLAESEDVSNPLHNPYTYRCQGQTLLFRFFRVLFKLKGVCFDSIGIPKLYLARTEQFLYLSPSPLTCSFTGPSMFETDRNESKGAAQSAMTRISKVQENVGPVKPFLVHLSENREV